MIVFIFVAFITFIGGVAIGLNGPQIGLDRERDRWLCAFAVCGLIILLGAAGYGSRTEIALRIAAGVILVLSGCAVGVRDSRPKARG